MTPRVRPFLLAPLLFAVAAASAVATDCGAEAKPDVPRDESRAVESARNEAKPGETPDRASIAPPADNDSSPPPPARDTAKPTRPANKQRPAWPPPPELIS